MNCKNCNKKLIDNKYHTMIDGSLVCDSICTRGVLNNKSFKELIEYDTLWGQFFKQLGLNYD